MITERGHTRQLPEEELGKSRMSRGFRGVNEGTDFRQVLAARTRLDAAGHVGHPGTDPKQLLGDVFRRQTAGQDQPWESGADPVRTRSQASYCCFNLRQAANLDAKINTRHCEARSRS